MLFRSHYDLSLPIDYMIPFTPFMMSVYVLAYVVWIVGFIVIGRESREVCYEVLTAEQIAKLCCLVAFIAIPTTIIRPFPRYFFINIYFIAIILLIKVVVNFI